MIFVREYSPHLPVVTGLNDVSDQYVNFCVNHSHIVCTGLDRFEAGKE